MKKTALILFLSLLLPLFAACAPALPVTETAEETTAPAETVGPEETKKEETKEETKEPPLPGIPAITETISWADLEAIPVARANMTESQLRDICVQYMLLQARAVYTVEEDVIHPYSNSALSSDDGYITIRRGTRYGGLPYSNAATDIAAFLDHYDSETGILHIRSHKSSIEVGNDCATDLFWGWARVNTTDTHAGTWTLVPKRGIIVIGDLEFNREIDTYKVQSTYEICQSNGEQRVFEAYALMKKADGMVTYKSGGNHHALMITEDPVVVRRADGSIDPQESYVLVVEQSSHQKSIMTADGPALRGGRCNDRMSFASAFKSYYLPITVPELAGTKKVEAVKFEIPLGETVTQKDLESKYITANYAISKATVTLTDPDGTEIYRHEIRGVAKSDPGPRRIDLAALLPLNALRPKMTEGVAYAVRIDLRMSNGETVENAYRGTAART